MTNPTSNFGWQMPTPTDLVTDLPADFEVFGQAVDTSMADLRGGTTGQILSKATNTDMDFTWITNDVGDITAVNVTAPITGGGTSGAVTIGVSAASTAAAGVVQLSDSTSTTSSVLASTPTATKSAYDLANTANTAAGSAQTTADAAYAAGFTNNFFAGKNKIINGNFGIWQRGTSGFTFGGAYNADRFLYFGDGTGVTRAITQQTFTPGTAPVSGYEGTYYFRYAQTVAGTGGTYNRLYQKIEDVRIFAAQTATLSFWAKADAARSVTAAISQNFGSGGSSAVATSFSGSASVTTSWQRFSFTLAIPSITGKTIGTSSYLEVDLDFPLNTTQTIEIWGVQMEAGSAATPFQTASGSVGGELALCQRYFNANAMDSTTTGEVILACGLQPVTTQGCFSYAYPVQMRVKPTITMTGLNMGDQAGYTTAATLNSTATGLQTARIVATMSANGAQYRPVFLQFPNLFTTAYLRFEAEL